MHKVAEQLGRLQVAYAGGTPATQVLWRRRRPQQLGAMGLLACAALGTALVIWNRQRQPPLTPPRPSASPSLPAPPAGEVPAPLPVPAAPQTIEWAISTTPIGAAVLDEATGTSLGQTPLKLTRRRQAGRRAVVLHLAGYRDVTLQLDGERDFSVERQLVPNPPPASKQPRKRNKDDLIEPTL
jgi:hypothetical protein